MKRVSWKYLAGLIDGEGCIDFAVQKHSDPTYRRMYGRTRLRILLVDSCRFLLESLQANLGGSLTVRKNEGKNPKWQNASGWEVASYKQVSPILRNVVNHLILKREQALFALWLDANIKGLAIHQTVIDVIREELTLMKRDPHRLSEKAAARVAEAIVDNPIEQYRHKGCPVASSVEIS